MTLDDLLHAARSCLGDLGNQPGSGYLEREAAGLRLRLRRSYDGLMRQRRLVESLYQHIQRKEKDAQALTSRVESYLQAGNQIKAWHHALELDRLRRSLERDRIELGRSQQGYHSLVTDIARMERHAARIDEEVEACRAQPASANAW